MSANSAEDLAEKKMHSLKTSLWPYYLLFFFSGFPALLYQIVWQRALFTVYGVNVESVTVIVTIFMLGLGLGSLAGGRLSTWHRFPALGLFGLIELSIGVFGSVSLPLIHWTGRYTAGSSLWMTGTASFFLLLLPTLLMGSTLPLLVEHLVRRTASVGGSVGALYAVNTLGSAAACFCAANFLMRALGESSTVHVAAAFNILVGLSALGIAFTRRTTTAETRPVAAASEQPRKMLSMRTGVLLSGVCGFVALAYEIVWYRIFAYGSGQRASIFATLLGFYLVGIAYGAFAVHDACRKSGARSRVPLLRGASFVALAGSSLAFLVAPAESYLILLPIAYVVPLCMVAVAAALMGANFPILAQESIGADGNAGKNLSYLYLSNIAGSVLGSFLVGFVVFNYASVRATSLGLLVLGTVLSIAFARLCRQYRVAAVAVAVCLVLAAVSGPLYANIYWRLAPRAFNQQARPLVDVVENRNGVVSVDDDQTVYGGGIYDGHFNIDPRHDDNGIFRAYAIAGLHPHPAHVLEIGLSSGSWAQVLVNMPGVEDLTIVEINPGYLQLIRNRPVVASLLTNPKVHIVIDDGRRWLVAHPQEKFDFILMNTTYSWIAHTSNLLSVEFMNLLRGHLAPGGVAFYNTTASERVLLTGATVYASALRIGNFLAVSDSPIVFDRERYRMVLSTMRIDGKPVFDLSVPQDRMLLEQMVAIPQIEGWGDGGGLPRTIEDRASLLRRLQSQPLITDDNMGNEWL